MNKMLNIDFIGKRRIYYTISLSLIAIGILVSVIFGVKMDIMFKGGTILQYQYTSTTVDKTKAASIAKKVLGTDVESQLNKDFIGNKKYLELDFDKTVNEKTTASLYTQLKAALPQSNLVQSRIRTVDPSMGREFFLNSILAVLLASLLIIVYIWIRFRHIGGLPAGITAFIALVHDVLMAFVAFSIFRIPLNDGFIAVALTILGYSINDTIVVFDRVRENKREIGSKMTFNDIVNKSINQTFARSINTTLMTFVAITVILVASLMFGITSITNFALPMMVGVVTGCYSTICIAGPLWVTWETYKEGKTKRLAEAKAAARAANRALRVEPTATVLEASENTAASAPARQAPSAQNQPKRTPNKGGKGKSKKRKR